MSRTLVQDHSSGTRVPSSSCRYTRAAGANLDPRAPGPVAAGAGHAGLAHVFGNVWEWTASAFAPYPGFVADPYADYSAPWFGSHRVIRGDGSPGGYRWGLDLKRRLLDHERAA